MRLSGIKSRLSYANVIATLALFIALGGVSYAAVKLPKNSVGTKQIKKNAVNSSKVKNRSLLAVDFKSGQLPRGASGPQGLDGLPGATGAQGATGPAGPRGTTGLTGEIGPTGPTGETGASTTAAMIGRAELPTGPGFFMPSGDGGTNSTMGSATMRSPAVLTRARNLQVNLTQPPGPNTDRVVALLANSQIVLSCVVPSAGTSCENTTTVGSVPPGSEIVMLSTPTGGGIPAAANVQFGYTLGP